MRRFFVVGIKSPFILCLQREALVVPMTKNFTWGKVGQHGFGADNAIVPITSVPTTNNYCLRETNFVRIVHIFAL